MNGQISRRGLLAGAALGATLRGAPAPASTVAVARCRTYADNLEATLARMFDQVGGLAPLVRNKTVAIKLNLTGQPTRWSIDPRLPYRTNPDTVLATAHLMARAGAR